MCFLFSVVYQKYSFLMRKIRNVRASSGIAWITECISCMLSVGCWHMQNENVAKMNVKWLNCSDTNHFCHYNIGIQLNLS